MACPVVVAPRPPAIPTPAACPPAAPPAPRANASAAPEMHPSATTVARVIALFSFPVRINPPFVSVNVATQTLVTPSRYCCRDIDANGLHLRDFVPGYYSCVVKTRTPAPTIRNLRARATKPRPSRAAGHRHLNSDLPAGAPPPGNFGLSQHFQSPELVMTQTD
jgi:hypothetical protein